MKILDAVLRVGLVLVVAAPAGCSSRSSEDSPSGALLIDLPASEVAVQREGAEPLPGRDASGVTTLSARVSAPGTSAEWAAEAQKRLEDSEYAFRLDGPRFVASSRSQALTMEFAARGATLRSPDASHGEPLFMGGASISRAEHARELSEGSIALGSCQASGEVDLDGNCLRALEAERGNVLERWENRRGGIEHSFVVRTREPGDGPLSVNVAVAGARARVDVSGTSALLESDTGPSFKYSGLRAWDANGSRLAAHMLAHDAGLALVVDDAAATYPITIDPLITNLTWRTDSSFSYGTAVALADVDGNFRDDLLVSDAHTVFLYRSNEAGPSTTASWTVAGQTQSNEFGHLIANAGDVNADGFEDALVFDRRYHNGSAFEPRVFLYHGLATGLSTTHAWTVRTGDTSPNFNAMVISGAGDVNADGFDDVIIGDPAEGDGRASVYLGSASGLATAPAWTVNAPGTSEQFGHAVALAGDVNNDGFDDVLVGAPGDEGQAFLYLGGSAGLATTAAWSVVTTQALAAFGFSLAGGADINSDGFDDVVVGAPFHDSGQIDEGRAFLYLGSATGLASGAAWTAENNIADGWLGFAVGMGDFNLDGPDDVVVGAPQELPDSGHAYLYHGTGTGLTPGPVEAFVFEGDRLACGDVNGDGSIEIALGNVSENNVEVYSGAPFFNVVQIVQAGAKVGTSVAIAGDVNSDGFDDVIVAAPYYENGNTDEGRVLIYHGTASGLSGSPARGLEIHQTNAFFGFSVAGIGDVNSDGFDDIAIGAPGYDNGQTDEGRVYVYHGGPLGIPTLPARTLEINQPVANFGVSVAAAGDVNGDPFDDLIVGADLYDNGQINEGGAFIYHGSPGGISATPTRSLESNQANSKFGVAVAGAGDVNADGFDDIIVGAQAYDNGQTDEGAVFVHHGSSLGIAASAARVLESNQASSSFGRSVAGAGDVNRDGFDDVVVGAHLFDAGQTNEGRAFVYRGSSTGLPATAAVTLEGNQAAGSFGFSVASAGDVDGDGFSDLLIGAMAYQLGMPGEGVAAVYSGAGLVTQASPLWLRRGFQVNAQFGYSVAGGGDIDLDGLSDLVIGAPGFDNGPVDQGRALIFH